MDKGIETLIKGKKLKAEDRWYPTSVNNFRNGFIVMDGNVDGYHPLVDNLAYNLQYLQFLEKEMKELELSSVLYVMLVKSYVVTGMGIIEGIFSYIIKTNGWWKISDEEIVLTSNAQQKTPSGDIVNVKTIISKKKTPAMDKMTFDEMIKCLNKHHKALSVDHLLYPQINRVRDLRNRVHLQKGDNKYDHDYNAFDYRVKEEMRSILYAVLCSPKVTDSRFVHNYDFLKT